MVDNLEIPSEILNKVKMEKSGDNYKLKFALKGKRDREYAS